MPSPWLIYYGMELFRPQRMGPHSYQLLAQQNTYVPGNARVTLNLKCCLVNTGGWFVRVDCPTHVRRPEITTRAEIDYSCFAVHNPSSEGYFIREGDPVVMLRFFSPANDGGTHRG